jgi:hypothetical protein
VSPVSLSPSVEHLDDLQEAIQNLQAGLYLRVVDQLGNQFAIGAITLDTAGMTIALTIDTTRPL